MRLLRGSGVDGLSAIRPINGRIVRPLLGMRRAELAAWLAAQGVDPVVDPSNEDIRFDRARIRLALADFPDFDPTLLMRSSEALREASEALDWAAAREAEARVTRTSDGVILDPRGLPRELLRRLVLACVARLDPGLAPRGPAVDLLLDALDRGEKRTIGGILCDHVRRDGASAWRFAPAPPRRTG